jgi:hypothetical protein
MFLRAADRWSLRNFLPRSSLFMVGKAQKSHGARFELNSVFGLETVDRWNPIRTSAIQFRSRPMRFLGFSNHEKGAPREETSKWSTVCSTFSRSGWSVVRGTSVANGGTSKNRPSLHLHKVQTRSNKMSPRTFQTALVRYQRSHIWTRGTFDLELIKRETPKSKILTCNFRCIVTIKDIEQLSITFFNIYKHHVLI